MEQAIFIAQSVAPGRIVKCGQGVQEARSESSEPAISKSGIWLLFFRTPLPPSLRVDSHVTFCYYQIWKGSGFSSGSSFPNSNFHQVWRFTHLWAVTNSEMVGVCIWVLFSTFVLSFNSTGLLVGSVSHTALSMFDISPRGAHLSLALNEPTLLLRMHHKWKEFFYFVCKTTNRKS